MWIVFEGCDGSGKTTLLAAVREELMKTYGVEYVFGTKEPTEDVYGKMAKQALETESRTDLALRYFFLDRWGHTDRLRMVDRHRYIILQDRYIASTAVYQGCLAGTMQDGKDLFRAMQHVLFDVPDLTVYLRFSSENSATKMLERIRSRGCDGFESRMDEQTAKRCIRAYQQIVLLHVAPLYLSNTVQHAAIKAELPAEGRATDEGHPFAPDKVGANLYYFPKETPQAVLDIQIERFTRENLTSLVVFAIETLMAFVNERRMN